ncbi:hypothetical protein OSB04_029897 [Centaurea solstitialis]|uniref:DUF659 domain-containing protein n=1 Tax=Centaurea solstitialis TaxID=347529 RepID=A0AA38S5T3_9ASTR|nr:hypothetical protein OSB04_029897 [Centaurea solstitialis]
MAFMFDFWANVKVFWSIFLKSIDALEHVIDAKFIVNMVNEVIEDFGEENMYRSRYLIIFVADNGSNFKAAR